MKSEVLASRSINSRPSRVVRIGDFAIGGTNPIAVQSMCATKTTAVEETLAQIYLLKKAGASLIRIAVDTRQDVEALRQIRQRTDANLVVDLQENYRLAEQVAPFVQKLRYNPGHLSHSGRSTSLRDKVRYLVEVALRNDCALRIGVNSGSLDAKLKDESQTPVQVALASAMEHCELLEDLGFSRYVVSLKSSDPKAVLELNRKFAALRPEVPLHLGVTEAGMLPDGERKTCAALVPLLAQGIGDTLRVSLTLPDQEKDKEVYAGYSIIRDVMERKLGQDLEYTPKGINVISCPSCSRVENKAFVKLALQVKEALAAFDDMRLTVAVMGCRVNGPGETDHADFGLWCAADYVNLKHGKTLLGRFPYDEVVGRLIEQINLLKCENMQQL